MTVNFRNQSLRRLKNFFGKFRQKARENFQGENNKKFDLTLFRKETIQIIFGLLHGIDYHEARDEIDLRSCRIMNVRNVFSSLRLS